MTANFVHNLDALVTRDYLDTRFTEFETRVEAGMDKRFIRIETKMDRRFVTVEARIAKLADAIELRFERMEGKFSRRLGVRSSIVAFGWGPVCKACQFSRS